MVHRPAFGRNERGNVVYINTPKELSASQSAQTSQEPQCTTRPLPLEEVP